MTWRKGGCIKTKRRTLAIIVQTPVGTVENGEEGERDITSFSFDFSYILSLHLSLAGYPGLLTWVSLQQPQEQRYPFLQCLWYFRVSMQRYGCQCLESLTFSRYVTSVLAATGITVGDVL